MTETTMIADSDLRVGDPVYPRGQHVEWFETPRKPELFAALAKAQGEMKNPSFDSVNPHLRSRYASLAAVRNAVIPPLAANGLAVVQDCRTTPVGVSVTTHLLHSSGQRMTFGPLEIPASKLDAQGFGAAETYARRFALLGLACVAGEEDQDGEAGEKKIKRGAHVPEAPGRAPPMPMPGLATAAQVKLIRKRLGDRPEAEFCKALGVESLEALQFDRVNEALEAASK
jgi:hypothetical protein